MWALIVVDPTGGPLAGSTTIKAHIGFNHWATVQQTDSAMTFNSNTNRWELSVVVPATASAVDVAFNNGSSTWDNNSGQDWHVTVNGTIANWVMDGQLDSGAPLVAQNGTRKLYAGVRGTVLYVAAPTNAGTNNDYFIFMAAAPGTMRAAPWAKAGQVAGWSAFLASESTNNYTAWTDQVAGTTVQSTKGAAGGVLEGTIDLQQEFGNVPGTLWLALGVYGTADGQPLVSSLQIQATLDDDGNLQTGEYASF